MRVICVVTLLTAASVARAQVPDGAPAEPATWVGAEAVGTVSAPSESSMERAGLVTVQASLAPAPWLELGGGIDLRGAILERDQGAGTGRGGAGPLCLWIGIGASGEEVAGGVRLVGYAGPRLVDLDDLDGGGPEGALGLQLDGAWVISGELEVAGTLGGSLIWDDVVSPVAIAQIDVFVGNRAVRPIAGVLVAASPDTAAAFHLRLGAEIAAGALRVTTLVIAAPPSDPAGQLIGLSISVVRSET